MALNLSRMSASSFLHLGELLVRARLGVVGERRLLDLRCDDLREMSSISCGMESISVRIMAQASSTRSMALSGRKRSEM